MVQVCKSSVLGPALEYYERVGPKHPDHTYEYLVKAVERYLNRIENSLNIANLAKGIKSGKGLNGDGKGTGKAVPATMKNCPQWLRGKCGKGDQCPNLHDPALLGTQSATGKGDGWQTKGAGRDAAGAKGAGGGGGGRGKGQGGAGGGGGAHGAAVPATPVPQTPDTLVGPDGRRPCFAYSRNKCKKGKECALCHCKLTDAMKKKREEFEAKNGAGYETDNGASASEGGNAKRACWKEIEGQCPDGANCRFSHKPEDLAAAKAKGGGKGKKGKGKGKKGKGGKTGVVAVAQGAANDVPEWGDVEWPQPEP